MKLDAFKWLLVGVLAVAPVGCESSTVIDGEPDGTTVIEDDDADTNVITPGGADTTPPADGGNTDININTPSNPPASGNTGAENQ